MKEQLFEDYTLEEAKSALQRVSEYMDGLIRRRRMSSAWDDVDVTEDEMWNIAHDVLEIIHFPEPTLAEVIEESVNYIVGKNLREMLAEVTERYVKGEPQQTRPATGDRGYWFECTICGLERACKGKLGGRERKCRICDDA